MKNLAKKDFLIQTIFAAKIYVGSETNTMSDGFPDLG